MIPRLEGGGGGLPRQHSPYRHSAAEPLRQSDDVRLDIIVLVGEHPASATQAGLDLIEDQHGSVGVAHLAGGGQVLRSCGIDTALAQHRLQQHGTGARADCAAKRLDVVEGHVHEAGGKRSEALVVLRLAGRRQRAERASMERLEGADDLVSLRSDVLVAMLAGELDGRFHRLRAAVAQEAPAAKELREALREAELWLGVEIVGHVQKRIRLLADRADDLRVAVAEPGHRPPAADEVQVLLASGVPQAGPLSPRHHHRHADGSVEVQQV